MSEGPMIDLRSDTVTRPTAAMRRAMAEAEVGDDVLAEDPTVHRLVEERAAAAVGHEAALFVPSGTMGNQIALRLLAAPASEVLCDRLAHVLLYEMGAMAALSGLQPRPLDSDDGLPAAARWEEALVPRGGYRVATGVLALEQSHNMAGGRVYDPVRVDAVLRVARRAGVPVHLDGARLFNAATALGVPAARLAAGFDTVMFCLSKGLGAPVGSLFVSKAVTDRRGAPGAAPLRRRHAPGRRAGRGRTGGPARRTGAARRGSCARHLPGARAGGAAGRRHRPGDSRDQHRDLPLPGEDDAGGSSTAASLVARLRALGVLVSAVDRERVRLVTHRDVTPQQGETAARALATALSA